MQMSVFKTEKAIYTPTDFVVWNSNEMLELSPNFQRNPVWRNSAKSYLIDTMLRDMTIPPIYLRIKQNKGATQSIREVVDGQQRIRTVLEFIRNEFRLSDTLESEWSGKLFFELSAKEQQQIMDFSFSVEMFKGISDQQIFEVFCRLNMNGVALNRQELRNARFFGLFKQSSYKLGLEHITFWRNNAIFSEQGLARMVEIELTSDLLIAGRHGMQDKKNIIDDFYKKYDDKYPLQKRDERRFRETMETIAETCPDGLRGTKFTGVPLFYSLYCVIYHHMYGMPQVQRPSPQRRFSAGDRRSLNDAIDLLSKVLVESKKPTSKVAKRYMKFVTACARQT